ncbi:MAG: 16S rRNA (guanine(966)-N(2))-methyltransferase RsmD [Burkholderiaceae bacterium]
MRNAKSAPGQVRIGGGLWKRTPLAVPDVDGLRPTPDRVRETLFNWLGQRLDGLHCLDPFAGSGVLGLEAASRGAAGVVMIERDPRAAAAIRTVIDRLGATQVTLHVGDALRWLTAPALAAARFDLVFLDPPFGQGWLDRVLPRLAPLLAPLARLYVEDDAPVDAERVSAGLAIAGSSPRVTGLRADKAGQVHYHLLEIRQPHDDRRGDDTW